MHSNPLISVIMPTYNSESTIDMVLSAIGKQTYKNYEILVIDGGSTDNTLEIAKKYGAVIINNVDKLPEYAKHLWLLKAKWKYAVFLDSDEVLLNPLSWEKKVSFLEEWKCLVKNFITAGLLNPEGFSMINAYINKIWDPFSFWLYENEGDDLRKTMMRKYKKVRDAWWVYVFSFEKGILPPICDGGGHFFDLSYLKSHFDINDPSVVTRVFTIMKETTNQLAVLEDDFINHYSTSTISAYKKKIKWRIINNIHYSKDKFVGFANREGDYSLFQKIKKYLFIPYWFSVIVPLFTALSLFRFSRNKVFLLHPYFSFYTAFYILYEYIKKILWKKTIIPLYWK